jgi:hypothetical protein
MKESPDGRNAALSASTTTISSHGFRSSSIARATLGSSHETPLRRSLFLRVQHTRIEASNYHARCALAMAVDGADAPRMRAIASRDA